MSHFLIVMLSAIMLSVIMLSVIMLFVIMLSVIMTSVIVLSVVMLNVFMLSVVVAAPNIGPWLNLSFYFPVRPDSLALLILGQGRLEIQSPGVRLIKLLTAASYDCP